MRLEKKKQPSYGKRFREWKYTFLPVPTCSFLWGLLGCKQGIPSFQGLAQRDGKRTPLTVTAQLPCSSKSVSWRFPGLGVLAVHLLLLPCYRLFTSGGSQKLAMSFHLFFCRFLLEPGLSSPWLSLSLLSSPSP